MSALEIRRLKAFGKLVHGDACRDLKLLRTAEASLDWLDVEHERLSQVNHAADSFIALVSKSAPAIGAADELVALFDSTRDSVRQYYDALVTKRQSAINDPVLDEDDGIVEAYDRNIDCVVALHEKLNTLSWHIGENAADRDETLPGTYTSAGDLFAAMGV